MSDSFSEVSSESWFGRIGSAIKGIVFGLLLFVISFPVLFWNEGRAVTTARSLDEGTGAVVAVTSDSVDSDNEKKLVHLSGPATTEETLEDAVFAVSVQALRLSRQVEMYQWKEDKKSESKKKLGGGSETVTTYTYSKDWSSTLSDSGSFKKPKAHANPGRLPFEEVSTQAKQVTLGAFHLTDSLIRQIRKPERIKLTEENIPASSRGTTTEKTGDEPDADPPGETDGRASTEAKDEADPDADDEPDSKPNETRNDNADPEAPPETASANSDRASVTAAGRLYFGADPSSPQVGDTKVGFTVTRPTDVSLIAQQVGESFQPYQTKAGDALNMLQVGVHGADEMFKAAHEQNRMLTWILRGVGAFVMFLGLSMMLRPLSVLADVIPLLGDIVGMGLGIVSALIAAALSLATIGFAWVFYRPLIGVPLLIVSFGLIVLLIMKRPTRTAV